ncbi:MAG TPA: aldo/keto reductase [Actinomycetota bacterium]|jgi:aryl-alcohol dehydrogenase-like predicted oxidoreductase|nr:aldo/keto reductase [Actinomycetota bacterium]
MQFRRLGRDGPELSVVGVGAWAIGGPWRFGWGPQDDDESIAALHKAFDAGVTWVDTAAVYGLGHSEEVVGQVLRERAGEALVLTKCGRPWYGREHNEPTYDLRPETIRFELEQSLKRLGTDHVDLYQFHWPDTTTGTPVEDSWGTMAELVTEGKVRWAGVCNFDLGLLERCQRIRHVDSLQPPYSLLDRAAAGELIPWCAANGTGVIGYSPLGSGLLSGSFDARRARELPSGDWRRASPEFQEPALSRNLALAERLEPVAERHGVPVAAVAVAWVLATPGVTGAIVGARRPSQVDGWLPAGSLQLTDADLAELRAAVEDTGV